VIQETGKKPTPTVAFERHFSVPELSKLLNLSPRTVRRMFQDEPTAVRIRTASQSGKRSYTTYRIPESTAVRVYQRHTGVDADDIVPAEVSTCPACGSVGSKPPHEPYGEINMARRRGQQTGHVHRQGDCWYLAYREDAIDEDGKIVRVRLNRRIASAKEVSKREAQRIARGILNEVDAQAQQPLSLLTVEEFVQRRFRPDVIRFKKPAGQSHYENMLKHVLPVMGRKRLRDVTNDDVQDLVGAKLDSGLSVQTVTHIRNVIGRVFNHAKLKRSFVGDNPTLGVNLPEMKRKESHALTFEQGRLVLGALPSPVSEMALVSMTCSLNVAELLALRWKWVNLTSQPVVAGSEVLPPCSLAVRQNYYRGVFGSVKADRRHRNVPLSGAVVAALSELKSRPLYNGPEDLVFASSNGSPSTNGI
jgi:integrase